MSEARIIFIHPKTKLVYQHMEGAPKYNLTAIEKEDFKDGRIYWRCRVKESGWYEEVIITMEDFRDERVEFK